MYWYVLTIRTILCILYIYIIYYYTLPGTLNITWNILNNGTLSLEWERPIWDTRNITRGVKINCSDSNYQILEYRDISDSMIVLAGLNLSATTTCCHTLMTLNETGPQKCDEYNNRSVAHGKLLYIKIAARVKMT